MHSKVLCQRVRYCFPDQINHIYKGTIVLKQGEHLEELFIENEAQYELQKTTGEREIFGLFVILFSIDMNALTGKIRRF
jgi:hypothetical protein